MQRLVVRYLNSELLQVDVLPLAPKPTFQSHHLLNSKHPVLVLPLLFFGAGCTTLVSCTIQHSFALGQSTLIPSTQLRARASVPITSKEQPQNPHPTCSGPPFEHTCTASSRPSRQLPPLKSSSSSNALLERRAISHDTSKPPKRTSILGRPRSC